MTNKPPELDIKLVRAQTRLLKAYSGFRRNGGWRALAEKVSRDAGMPINQKYIYELCAKNIAPANPEIRDALTDWRLNAMEQKAMTDLEQRISAEMKRNHIGRAHAIKTKDLLFLLFGEEAAADRSTNNRFSRELREAIVSLNHDHEALICSTPADGYFWASSLREGQEAVSHLEKRARTQLDNTSHLRRNLQRKFGGQLTLEGIK